MSRLVDTEREAHLKNPVQQPPPLNLITCSSPEEENSPRFSLASCCCEFIIIIDDDVEGVTWATGPIVKSRERSVRIQVVGKKGDELIKNSTHLTSRDRLRLSDGRGWGGHYSVEVKGGERGEEREERSFTTERAVLWILNSGGTQTHSQQWFMFKAV